MRSFANLDPLQMSGVDGSMERWEALKNDSKMWRRPRGPGSLEQMRLDAEQQAAVDGECDDAELSSSSEHEDDLDRAMDVMQEGTFIHLSFRLF